MIIKKRKTGLDAEYNGILHSPTENPGKRVVVGIFNYPKHGYALRLSSFNFVREVPGTRPVDCAFGAHTEEPHVLIAWCYQEDLLKLLGVQRLKMIEFAQSQACWIWGDEKGEVHWHGEKGDKERTGQSKRLLSDLSRRQLTKTL